MPRKTDRRPCDNKRKQYKEEDMARAIKAVREKTMGYLKASKTYGVPRTTLFRLCQINTVPPDKAAVTKLRRKCVLGPELEKLLVEYILIMESKFYGLTMTDLRRKRHPMLSIRKPTGTSFSRAVGFCKERVDGFFDLLEKQIPYSLHNVYNVDETGLTIVQTKVSSVIELKGKRQVASLTSAERRALITVIFCMNAAGIFVPPLVIFPRKNMNMQLMKGAPPGSVRTAHPSGWVQSHIFISTHKLQPLDRSFMGPLKVHYSEEIRIWVRQNQRTLSPFDIMELFEKAYEKVQRCSIAANGFRTTGIAAEQNAVKSGISVNIEEAITTKLSTSSTDKPSCSKSLAAVVEKPSCSKTPCKDTAPFRIDQNQNSASEVDLDLTHQLVSPFEISPVPSTFRKRNNQGRKTIGSTVITSSPYKDELNESISKKTEKEAKARGVKRNLSSRKSLKQKRGSQTQKKSKHRVERPKSEFSSDESEDSRKNVEFDDSDNDLENMPGQLQPNEDDAHCMFCEHAFSTDQRGELWVQCLMCSMWAHNECAGAEKDEYVCDWCK